MGTSISYEQHIRMKGIGPSGRLAPVHRVHGGCRFIGPFEKGDELCGEEDEHHIKPIELIAFAMPSASRSVSSSL